VTDKPTTSPEKDTAQDTGLLQSAYDVLKSGYESVKSYVSGEESTALEKTGKLPELKIDGEKESAKAGENKAEAKPDAKPEAKPETPEIQAKAALTNPETSHEDKLKAAKELAKTGETNFSDSSGRNYKIDVQQSGSREWVSVKTTDADGNSHPVLRGTFEKDGSLHKQHDDAGKEVPYVGKWAGENLKDSPLVAGKDQGDAKSATEFVKNHSELKLLTPTQEAQMQKDLDAKSKQLEADRKDYDHLMGVGEKYLSITKDIQKATGTNNEQDAVAKFKELPAEKQQEFVKRVDEIRDDIPKLQKLVELGDKVDREEKSLAAVKEKMSFTKDMRAVDALPEAQKAEVYKNFEKIMDRGDKSQTTNLSAAERTDLVKDIAHNIANPQDVKQGNKGTCALASTEYVLARSHPDVYAKTVAEFATKGEYMGAKISADEIHKDDGNNIRGFASKVFQTGAAELAVQDSGSHYDNYKPGTAPPVELGKKPTPADDTGERLVDKDGKVRDWPGLTTEQEVKLINKLTGADYESEKLYANSSKMLQQQLETEISKHGLPLKVGFYYDDSAHAVTITGIDKSTNPPKIVYDDTAQPRGKSESMDMQKFYELALNGPTVYKINDKPMILLTAGRKGERIDPYVEVIHKK
jgi:hypothetical protein